MLKSKKWASFAVHNLFDDILIKNEKFKAQKGKLYAKFYFAFSEVLIMFDVEWGNLI